MMLDANGKPIRPEDVPCSRCGKTGDRSLITGFGGHWAQICACGNETDSGRGDVPGFVRS
jgi:hypothetical protein